MRTFCMIFIVAFYTSAFAQNASFDSIYVIASSDQYDYKNPAFGNQLSQPTSYTWLSCERYKTNGACDIALRRYSYTGYGPEIILTSAVNDSNINPAIYDNFIVWESNRNGNRDIYYSTFNGTIWSAPMIVPGSTQESETRPFIQSDNAYSPGYFFLTYKRGPDIILKKYSVTLNTWDAGEYNLTDSISEDCSYPVIVHDYLHFSIAFIKNVSDMNNKIILKRFDCEPSTGVLTFQNSISIDRNVEPRKMKISESYGAFYLTFTNVTDNLEKEIYALYPFTSSPSEVLLKDMSFTCLYSGKGTYMGYNFEQGNNSLSGNIYFSAFGFISRSLLLNQDSAVIYLYKGYNSPTQEPNLRINVGDANSTTELDISPPQPEGNYYRVSAVWEQKINGRSALKESYMTQILNSVNYLGTAVKYSLQQNYPNPFNPVTKIEYEIPVSAQVELKVYNALGKEVASLVDQKQSSGKYNVDFNGSNFASGIYFYTLKAGNFIQTRKMLLIK